MIFFRIVRSINSRTHQKIPKPSTCFRYLPLSHRSLSTCAQLQHQDIALEEEEKKNTEKKPLNIVFKEAIKLVERTDDIDEANERSDVKRKLRKLEEEVRNLELNSQRKPKKVESKPQTQNLKLDSEQKPETKLKKDCVSKVESKPKSLLSLFTENTKHSSNFKKLKELEPVKRREEPQLKELSADAIVLANELYKEGYFNSANFLPPIGFDVSCLNSLHALNFTKFAAERFGKDHHEIAKWLSGSDLKKVALFGCPSLDRKDVFSAKRLRRYFRIQEDIVCGECILRNSCKFVNQSVWRGDSNNFNLAVVMRILTVYALELGPGELVVPEDVKASIIRLLKQVLSLSKTIP
ncbi:hypothetical protein RJ641_034265 [Dillenia turbinata]|uniref:Uncharacterized protein n=1 Tax=Dillenia turbinata TaxID=194707 RepID=A0AAN8ZH45_9MAGN